MKKIFSFSLLCTLLFSLLFSNLAFADIPSVHYRTVIEYEPVDTGNTFSNRDLLRKGFPEFFDVKWGSTVEEIKNLLATIGLTYDFEEYSLSSERIIRMLYLEDKNNEPFLNINGLHVCFYCCGFDMVNGVEIMDSVSLQVTESPTEVAKILTSRYGPTYQELGLDAEMTAFANSLEIYRLHFFEGDKTVSLIVSDDEDSTHIGVTFD